MHSSDAEGVPTLAVVGPTASGKSALALALADRDPRIEVVSVDSMQVYRGMDVGTAKPTRADRRKVPHHLLDLLDPDEECTVAWFQRQASRAVAEIRGRGGVPVLVGGTGLYHRAVIDELEIPPRYPGVLADLEALPTAELASRLTLLDPTASGRTQPGNRRRLLRALEVTIGSGRPFSSFGPGLETYPTTDVVIVGLEVSRPEIGARIEGRLARQMEAGFLDEVAVLSTRPRPLSRTASQALGYRELRRHLEGYLTLDECLAETATRTRRFAVRQDRWFRRDPRVRWLPASDPSVAGAVWRHWRDGRGGIRPHREDPRPSRPDPRS